MHRTRPTGAYDGIASVPEWQPNASGGLAGGFCYLAPADLPNVAVVLRLDEKAPPFWARWHKNTGLHRGVFAVRRGWIRRGEA